jgi:hypothetical protein
LSANDPKRTYGVPAIEKKANARYRTQLICINAGWLSPSQPYDYVYSGNEVCAARGSLRA